MCLRDRQRWLLLVLLLFIGVSSHISPFAWAQSSTEYSSLPVHFTPAAVFSEVDFDDDRVSDALSFTASGGPPTSGGYPDIEIYLSYTRTLLILPLDSVSPDKGSLSVRDLDSDGDEDLLWKGVQVLAPAEVIVWLNDGRGQFARVLPPGSLLSQSTPGFSLRTDSPHSTRRQHVYSLQQYPTSLGILSVAGIASPVTRARRDAKTAHFAVSFLHHFPPGRAPPTHLS